ncbi:MULTISPECIES: hypothetical protein [Burkholderia]|uniref:DSBA oxidoreductase n=1 Tax=Burkholderia sola TaxID=2843302 RepID=A0ABV2C1B3_9BURK|nr:hypothetical protein [Burkholderia sp. CpTa8-5]MBP0604982.1 hypothetical protein [Burkholderia sp. CpTa8-5]
MTLADIAADYGFNRDQARAIALDPERHHRVEAEAFKSANAGVRSVPHFVFGESIPINGGRSEDEIAGNTSSFRRDRSLTRLPQIQ